MTIWVVLTNFMRNGYFGGYSSPLNARNAIKNFFKEEPNFSLEDTGNYSYIIHNLVTGEDFWMEITYDEIDADVPQEGKNND